MQALIKHLVGREPGDIVWYSPAGSAITVADLTESFRDLQPSKWRGKRVALGPMPTEELALALVVLDGVADVLLLLPTEDSSEVREHRLKEARIDLVLSEGSVRHVRAADAKSGRSFTPIHFEEGTAEETVKTTWLLPTSGTTGIPKLIPHSCESLTRAMSDRFVGAKHIWASLYSIRRFAGLQVFLQSWLACTPLVLNEEGCSIDVLMENLVARRCTALSGTPSMWKKLSMHPQFDALNVQQITLGGEIVDQAVLDMLKRRKPAARVTHIYASTEAGVGFVVRDGKAGFPLDYVNTVQGELQMRIDENMHLQFRKSTVERAEGEEWIDSGDLVKIESDRIIFLGRANGSINVGGNKVMPEEVEQVIDELPHVAFVQVRPRKSAMLGNLVEAAILPAAGVSFDSVLKKTIIDHCRSRLEPFKVPAFVVEVGEIKLAASGKILRGPIN